MQKKSDSIPEVTHYTPESRLRHPLRLLKEMWHDLKASRELGWRLFVRDISAQYRQTALGYFWAIFPPLVSTFILIVLKSSSMIEDKGFGMPYPAYAFMGTVFFQVFVDSLNAPLKVINNSKAILTKINMPREAFILSGIGDVLFSFSIKLLLLVCVFVIYGVKVGWEVFLVPIPLLGMLIMGTMIGVLLIPFGLLFQDIQSALLIFTSGLLFISPVGYSTATGGLIGKLMQLNPVTPLLMAAKDLVAGHIPSNLMPFVLVFGSAFILLVIGWMIYRLALPIIIERIGM